MLFIPDIVLAQSDRKAPFRIGYCLNGIIERLFHCFGFHCDSSL